MSVKPAGNFVTVLKDKEEHDKKSSGGIYLPGAEDKMVVGKVVAVGPGRVTDSGVLIPSSFKPGDRVLFNKNLAVESKVDDETVLFLREEQIFGTVEWKLPLLIIIYIHQATGRIH